MNIYDVGNTILLSVSFTDPISGSPVAPSVVTLRVMNPLGVETDYQAGSPGFSNPSLGNYSGLVFADLTGVWAYRWEASGSILAAADGQFQMVPTPFSPTSLYTG